MMGQRAMLLALGLLALAHPAPASDPEYLIGVGELC
jgi:hypothetical protein